MLDTDQIGEAIRGWIEGVTSLPCIYSDGAGPRPENEYLTIKIASSTQYGEGGEFEATTLPDDTIRFDHSIIHSAMVSVNCYRGSAFSTISKLLSSLGHITTLDLFTSAGIGIDRASDIREVSANIGQKWEDRAQIDFFFNVRSASSEIVEGIKQVEVTNEIDGTTTLIKHPDLP